ncbi:MAG: ABC transporter ATP-binding protein/permease [Gammaproteobacteria bacterium]|nr:ABC transporter ATP-binding protein/permease [Gammaproteobacteria bacterium]MDH3537588.1 ABC transporter ATP-binding protein/permease [Gammaproteobacteria bacterium]
MARYTCGMDVTLTIARDAPPLSPSPWRFALYFYLKSRYTLFGIFVFEAAQAACTILLPYAIKEIIDAVTLAHQTGADIFAASKNAMILFALLNLGIVLFSRASGAMLVMTGPYLRAEIRKSLFSYLQHHSHRYFISHFAGSLANRIAEVSMSSMHALWSITFDFYPLIIKSLVALIILFGASGELALVLSLWLGIYIYVSYLLARRCRVYAKDFAEARSLVTGKIVDSVTNVMNAKMFARRHYEEDYLTDYLNHEVDHALRTYWYMEKLRWFQFTAAMVLMVAMVGYALKIWSDGDLTVGEFSMVAGLTILLIEAARGLSRSFLEFFEYLGNISDGVSVFVQSHEIVDKPDAAELQVDRGEICFRDVSFIYKEGMQVFKHLSVTIESKQQVGLVGFSGSGKSTFVNLILRLFEPHAGAILIDGQNILDVTQDSLRENVSMIPQDPLLFHRSLMENIRYGRLDATEDEVIEAAQKAHAHDFILQTEQRYDSLVGERGIKLSGGQRQRIAIARAILKNAPILILDEATSSLDSVTEKKIQLGLENLMKGRTVVVIAHRLSTISHMDRILVFDQGRIIEDGSHKQLLQRNGHYAHLWNMQAGGFLPEKDES